MPGVKVPHRLGAVAAGGGGVGGDQVPEGRLAGVLAAALGVAEEEELVAGEPADHRRRASAERCVIGVVGGGEAGEVGDVLAQSELAVEMEAGKGLVGVVMAAEGRARFPEMGAVGAGPPVAQPPFMLQIRAESGEAVADLLGGRRSE